MNFASTIDEDHGIERNSRFVNNQNNLLHYDQLTSVECFITTNFVEASDKELFSNDLSATVRETDPLAFPASPHNF